MNYRPRIKKLVEALNNRGAASASRVSEHVEELLLDSGCDTTDPDEITITAVDLEEMAEEAINAAKYLRGLIK